EPVHQGVCRPGRDRELAGKMWRDHVPEDGLSGDARSCVQDVNVTIVCAGISRSDVLLRSAQLSGEECVAGLECAVSQYSIPALGGAPFQAPARRSFVTCMNDPSQSVRRFRLILRLIEIIAVAVPSSLVLLAVHRRRTVESASISRILSTTAISWRCILYPCY